MKTMNIALSQALETFVRERVKAGESASASAYVRKLIREDQKRKLREQLDAALQEGLDSGEPIEVTPEFWEARRQELKKRLARKERKSRK